MRPARRRPVAAPAPRRAPRSIAVVGGGMVGLATAWFLQEGGATVTVYERRSIGAGASWGNAGWLTPGLAAPLPEPAVLRYGLRAVLSPRSPVYLPLRADPVLLRFLATFVRHSTMARWRRGMAALVPLNQRALEAFDVLVDGGVHAATSPAEPLLACYRTVRQSEALVEELEEIRAAGQGGIAFEVLSGPAARALAPTLTDEVCAAVQVHGQRYLNPPEFLRSLADSIRARVGTVREGIAVRAVRPTGDGVVLDTTGEQERHDAVVLATGAELGTLARRFGVRRVVQAGRGYSFSVPVQGTPTGPLYFPEHRVACTPLGDRLRIAGMMEFRRPEEPLDPRRIAAIADGVRPFLSGVDLDARRDEWVGARPCTGDGLPLLGRTAAPGVFVAGGHGMWGIALGPVTGRLVARTVLEAADPPELRPFDALR